MSTPQSPEITELLVAWSQGEESALERLMPMVYDELRRIARRHMNRESAGHPLQTTALVHEAYLRLVRQDRTSFQNRAHFFAISAQAMRRILVSAARERDAAKRGGGVVRVTLEETALVEAEKSAELLALDRVLLELAELDPRRARVVELRYFGGLSVEETAEVLQMSPETVMRDWKRAKAWLHSRLSTERTPSP